MLALMAAVFQLFFWLTLLGVSQKSAQVGTKCFNDFQSELSDSELENVTLRFGVWDKCPSYITSYAGCIVPVEAVFHPDSCQLALTCNKEDIKFHIQVENLDKTVPDPSVFPDPTFNKCFVLGNVSTNFTKLNTTYNVQFLAHRVALHHHKCFLTQLKLCCDDHIVVKDQLLPAPKNVSISYAGQMANISWSAHADYNMLKSTSGIEGYRVYIINETTSTPYLNKTVDRDATNVTMVNVTTPSCVQIYAVYCNGQNSKSFLSPVNNNTQKQELNATVDCDGTAHIELSIPEHLQGYQINNYTLYINELNKTFKRCNSSIDIELNGSTFSFNQLYTGKIWASVCGGLSHIYDFTLRTSISVPLMSKDISYNVAIINANFISVSLKAKVSNITCKIGFPTKVTSLSLCNNSYHNDQSTNIHLTDEGEALLVNELLPSSQICNITVNLTTDTSLPTDIFQYFILIETSYPRIYKAKLVYDTIKLAAEMNSSCLLGCCDVLVIAHSSKQNETTTSRNSCFHDLNGLSLNQQTVNIFMDATATSNCNGTFLVCHDFKADLMSHTAVTVPEAANSQGWRIWGIICILVLVLLAVIILLMFIVCCLYKRYCRKKTE